MKVSVAVRLDGLLRALRLTGHALAESAERAALRLARRSANRTQHSGPGAERAEASRTRVETPGMAGARPKARPERAVRHSRDAGRSGGGERT